MDWLTSIFFPDTVELQPDAEPRVTPFLGREVHHIHASEVTTTLTGQAYITDAITGETHIRDVGDITSIGPAVNINRELY